MDDFDKQKLVWTPVNSEYRFTILPPGFYINNSLFMITGEGLLNLCGILNSAIFRFYLDLLLSSGSYAYGSGSYFLNVPVPRISNTKNLERTVMEIHEKKVRCENTNSDEQKIDNELFEYYGFSKEEVSYISSFQNNK